MSRLSKPATQPGARSIGLALLLLGAVLALPRLGDYGLWDPWEPRYVGAAEEMAARGDWIVPYYRDEARLNRPPLTYWMIGLSHELFGRGDARSRLPSALLAIGCPALLGVALALRGRPWEGLLAGAALITSPQWLLLGRFATLALPLAAFLGLVLAAVIALPGLAAAGARRAAFAAIVLALAAAALTDFPRGLLLPAWAVLGWGLLHRSWLGLLSFLAVAVPYHVGQLGHDPVLVLLSYVLALACSFVLLVRHAKIRPRVLLAGALFVILLVAPWFLAVAGLAEDELKLFNYKYALNLGEDPGEHTGPYLYVLGILAAGGFVWCAAAAAGLWLAVGTPSARNEPLRVLAGALIGTVTFFVLSEARMGHFYVACQPALAGLAGVGLGEVVRRRDWKAALPLLVTAVVVMWLVREEPSQILESATVRANLFRIDLATPATLALACWTALSAVAWFARRPAWCVLGVLPTAMFAGYVALASVPALDAKKSCRAIWQRYLDERRPGEPLALFGVTLDSAHFYARGSEGIDDAAELREFLLGPGPRFLVLPHQRIELLQKMAGVEPKRVEPLDETHPTYALVRYAAEAR